MEGEDGTTENNTSRQRVSNADIDDMLMDFHISLRPRRDEQAVEKLAILDSTRGEQNDATYTWVMMDSGAANHVCVTPESIS